MKLYHVSQTQNDDYDTYSDFVVCAPDEETALNTHPDGGTMTEEMWESRYSSWCSGPEHVTVRLIGDAAIDCPTGVVCASYHAG